MFRCPVVSVVVLRVSFHHVSPELSQQFDRSYRTKSGSTPPHCGFRPFVGQVICPSSKHRVSTTIGTLPPLFPSLRPAFRTHRRIPHKRGVWTGHRPLLSFVMLLVMRDGTGCHRPILPGFCGELCQIGKPFRETRYSSVEHGADLFVRQIVRESARESDAELNQSFLHSVFPPPQPPCSRLFCSCGLL